MNRLLNDLFSCTMKMTCWIGVVLPCRTSRRSACDAAGTLAKEPFPLQATRVSATASGTTRFKDMFEGAPFGGIGSLALRLSSPPQRRITADDRLSIEPA